LHRSVQTEGAREIFELSGIKAERDALVKQTSDARDLVLEIQHKMLMYHEEPIL
jgi:hypothetical protein